MNDPAKDDCRYPWDNTPPSQQLYRDRALSGLRYGYYKEAQVYALLSISETLVEPKSGTSLAELFGIKVNNGL